MVELVLMVKDWLLDVLTAGWWSRWQGGRQVEFYVRKGKS